MANISKTANPIFNIFFFKCAEFNFESPICIQIFDISYSFFTKREKLIFGPGNHEIGNTAKFRRDGEKWMPDSDSTSQNHMETTGFMPVSKTFFLQQRFPLLKGKCQALGGTLRDPFEENKDNFGRCLSASLNIPNSNICETRLYFEFTATNRMSGKNLWAEIFGPKVGKVGYFQHFFQFFEYNFRNIHFRRKFLTT